MLAPGAQLGRLQGVHYIPVEKLNFPSIVRSKTERHLNSGILIVSVKSEGYGYFLSHRVRMISGQCP